MKQDFFTYPPSEITTNILSRLPVRTIVISKCVCKPWLHLIENHEFVKSHLSKSSPALAVLMPEGGSNWCTIFEFEDELEVECHERRYNPLTKFDFPHSDTAMEGSANGLLFLHNLDTLYVCNPITHEFVELRCPQGFVRSHPRVAVTYGFGASKITGQHKVVGIFQDSFAAKLECRVYALGTGSWRCVEAGVSFYYQACTFGAFVNGNLHWIVSDSNGTPWISCFDLETECFTTYSAPPLQESSEYLGGLSPLHDCLCFSDNTSEDEIVIWLMKEYGVEKSWTKEFVMSQNPDFDRDGYENVYPIKVFKDGDLLMLWAEQLLFFYSSKTKTTQEIGCFDARDDYINSMLLTPSFLSLKSLGMDNVISF